MTNYLVIDIDEYYDNMDFERMQKFVESKKLTDGHWEVTIADNDVIKFSFDVVDGFIDGQYNIEADYDVYEKYRFHNYKNGVLDGRTCTILKDWDGSSLILSANISSNRCTGFGFSDYRKFYESYRINGKVIWNKRVKRKTVKARLTRFFSHVKKKLIHMKLNYEKVAAIMAVSLLIN